MDSASTEARTAILARREDWGSSVVEPRAARIEAMTSRWVMTPALAVSVSAMKSRRGVRSGDFFQRPRAVVMIWLMRWRETEQVAMRSLWLGQARGSVVWGTFQPRKG